MFFAYRLSSRSSTLSAFCLFVALLGPKPIYGQVFSYTNSPVVDVIRDIENATSYRFLYRDALVSGVVVSFIAKHHDLLSRFDAILEDHGLRLQIDRERNMVFVLPLSPVTASFLVGGTVSDAQSLERLPHATIMWKDSRGMQGVAADDAGRFLIELRPDSRPITLVASYLGHRPDSVRFDARTVPHDLSLTLQPLVVIGSEVVVSSPLLSSNLDSTWFHLLGAPLAVPVGEQSMTRALQALPAVGLTTAVSSGLNVRGSRTDGFQILLDGIPIFNQSHLFGLFDAFNPDALQAVDFYYGVAPARFQAPPGGTLSYLTRSGSKRGFKKQVGVASTAVSTTLEGPAGTGRGSWLLSARRSYVDAIPWLNNEALVATGLGVGRETSETRMVPLDERTLVSDAPSASFYDIHAKFEHESRTGATFQISAYAGGDHATQDGERVIALAPHRQDPLIRSPVTTTNDWGNFAITAHLHGAVQRWGYSHTYVGFSRYRGSFRKDDFFYRSPQQGNASSQFLFAPFLNENSLSELRFAHESYFTLSPTLSLSAGLSSQRLVSFYDELSALRREFSE